MVQSAVSRSPRPRRRRLDGEQTRRRILDATVESILDNGYYHTSSNEIARRAGFTWGTIQHWFGSRDALLLEVMNDFWAKLEASLEVMPDDMEVLEDRLMAVLDILALHYGTPEQVAHLQILLDLIQNPNTSDGIRQAALEHGRGLNQAWRPLFSWALGPAAQHKDLVVYAFKVLRGYLTGESIATQIHPARAAKGERQLVVDGVAAAIRAAAQVRGTAVS